MSPTKDDAAVYQELVDSLGEDYSIDDFRPDDAAPMSRVPGELLNQRIEVVPGIALVGPTPDVMVSQTVRLELPFAALQKLIERAEAAQISVDSLISEWVAAEAGADNTISRDELFALLARRHPRSA
ncbi:hypothetical protein [Nocardia salmonicida]|uniref:hypothetical protein n=1 Tax=Nocardia salmonicida TaxID=53431 RepID=UPI0037B8A26A